MKHTYDIGGTVFGKWRIERKIGEGSFGTVYEIRREDFGQVYRAALKVITVPQSETELKNARQEGMDDGSIHTYFYSMVEDIVREFALMSRLKGMTNVVSYEDHEVVPHDDGMGWDILIRMELLTPLLEYAYDHPFSRRDIIRLGIDMCRALELCQKYNIIHRDVKPENIFVSGGGDFKLGDFGIARTVEKTMSGMSKKGTYNYMAPEVYRGGAYGFSVDTYSLGVVMYRLLNNNRLPFLPQPPEPITYSQRETALAKRMGGEQPPAPVNAGGRLGEIVLRACAFAPEDRYSSPGQMRQELEAIQYGPEDAALIYPSGDELALYENQYVSRRSQGEKSEEPSAAPAPAAAEVTEKTESVFGGGVVNSPEPEKTPEEFFTPAGGERAEDTFHPITEGTERTESVFGHGEQPQKPAAPRKPKKRGVLIAAIAAAVVLLAAGVALWWNQITTLPADVPVGPALESEPADSPEPSSEPSDTPEPAVLPTVIPDGEMQSLRSMNGAVSRQPMDTVRVAALACEEWLFDGPSAGNIIGDGIEMDIIRVDDWLREDGVIQYSYNQEIYYSDDTEARYGESLKSIFDRIEQLLDADEYDLIVCYSPWVDYLQWDNAYYDRLVKIADAHPDKEILLSGGLSAWYGYDSSSSSIFPVVSGERAINLTAALTNNLNPYEPVDLPEYMLGVAAALRCKSGKLGVTVTKEWDIFAVQAFAAGAASVDSNIELLLYGNQLTTDGEADAVKRLCEAGADVIWCSDYNEAACKAAEEYGALACCISYTLPDQAPAAGLAVSGLGSFDSDVRLVAECMKEGLDVWPQLLTPAYVYLRGGVTEELFNQMWDASFNRFRGAGDNLFGDDLADSLTLNVLHMPERPAELGFLGDLFADRWFVRDDFNNQVGYTHSGKYYDVTDGELQELLKRIRSMTTDLEYFGADSLVGTLEWEGKTCRVDIYGGDRGRVTINWCVEE